MPDNTGTEFLFPQVWPNFVTQAKIVFRLNLGFFFLNLRKFWRNLGKNVLKKQERKSRKISRKLKKLLKKFEETSNKNLQILNKQALENFEKIY